MDGGAVTLPYYNASNPAQAYAGPNNSGVAQNTVRQGQCVLQLKEGIAANTGTQAAPAADPGFLPLWTVTVANGQTQIASPNIAEAGGAAFLAGLLNSHHGGIAGEAPKIQLSASAEVQGVLPLANLPASDSSSAAYGLPAMTLINGNPNGAKSGNCNVNNASDLCFDLTNGILYVCAQTGGTTTAVWRRLTGFNGRQVYGQGTYSFTVPAGVYTIFGRVWGAGGGGGGANNSNFGDGGGGGGYAEGWFSVTPGQVITIIVGAGGAAGYTTGGNGGNGGSSSIGSYMSATGGLGGPGDMSAVSTGSFAVPAGGTGYGGDEEMVGGTGGVTIGSYGAPGVVPGDGGGAPKGGQGGTAAWNQEGQNGVRPGGGGAGGAADYYNGGSPNQGGNGADGLVELMW